jgi:PAS domain S-box-containing protein
MKDDDKPKAQLIEELIEMRQRIAELEVLETKCKRLEEQLHYQDRLLQHISDAVISTDMEFNIQSWNKSAEKMYGWAAEEVLGKPVSEVIRTEYPHDLEEDVIRQFQETGLWRGEVIQKRRDDNPIDIIASVSKIKDREGNPVGAVAINRDITKRKQAEEALRKVHDELEQRVEERAAELRRLQELK